MGTYLTVAEVAKLAGVSYQAIYKRLNKAEFQGLVREIDGKKMLNDKILNYFQTNKNHANNEIETQIGLLEKIVVRAVREHTKVIEKKIEILIELEKQNQLKLQRLADSLELNQEVEIEEVKYKEKEKKFMNMCGERKK